MYYFSVGGIFKNESHIMKEWLEHYFYHGIDHIYLKDDESTDDYMTILEPYIKEDRVTLYKNDIIDDKVGRQKNIYNKYFLPIIKESKWFGIFDLDEFLWSPRDINIKNVLQFCTNLSQIQINHNLFGSNGLKEHPKYIIPNFTKRADYNRIMRFDMITSFKYIINTDYEYCDLDVHHAFFVHEEDENNKSKFVRVDYSSDLENPWFAFNHYKLQSEEFWRENKCKKGDADNFKIRDMQYFYENDFNDVEDLRLYEQNKVLYNNL